MDELIKRIQNLLTNPLFKSVVASSKSLKGVKLPDSILVFREESPQRRLALALTGQVPTPALVEIDGDFVTVNKMPEVDPIDGNMWTGLDEILD